MTFSKRITGGSLGDRPNVPGDPSGPEVSPTLAACPAPPPVARPCGRRRRRRWRRGALAAVLLAAGTACTGEAGGSGAADGPTAEPTPITEFDADAAALTRGDFCARIPEEAVTAAVGEVAATDHYGNGEREPITDGVTDVAHEFNCTFVGDVRRGRPGLGVRAPGHPGPGAVTGGGRQEGQGLPSRGRQVLRDPGHRQRLHDPRRDGGGVPRAVHRRLVQLLGDRGGSRRADPARAGRAVVREHRERPSA